LIVLCTCDVSIDSKPLVGAHEVARQKPWNSRVGMVGVWLRDDEQLLIIINIALLVAFSFVYGKGTHTGVRRGSYEAYASLVAPVMSTPLLELLFLNLMKTIIRTRMTPIKASEPRTPTMVGTRNGAKLLCC